MTFINGREFRCPTCGSPLDDPSVLLEPGPERAGLLTSVRAAVLAWWVTRSHRRARRLLRRVPLVIPADRRDP